MSTAIADWCVSAGSISICGTDMIERFHESQGIRWCFRCRTRHEFWWVVMAPAGISYYDPTAHMEGIKPGCRDLFPGRYWSFEEEDG